MTPRSRPARTAATALPVARIAVDIPLAHLDRPFDYLVDERDSAAAQPGVRVRVRFSGRLVDGIVLERVQHSDHDGRLAMIERVISPEQVLTPAIAHLVRDVADRYAGTMADVLRLAVPPRHGRVEAEPAPDHPAADRTPHPADVPPAWHRYDAADAFIAAIGGVRIPRAVWQALPGEDWPARYAELARTVQLSGRGALLLVPDARDLARLEAALTSLLPAGSFVALSADLGPAERYRRFLAIARGQVTVVIGTRSAVFAPVANLALVALFDDGDDLYAEPRAPYPHAREVLMMRSVRERAALLMGGYARTVEGQMLVESGWAGSIQAPREQIRAVMPRISAAGDDYAVGADSAAARARLSPAAFAAARTALAAGAPVLVQVPRRGYLPSLACVDCRRPARCARCGGPLAIPAGGGAPTCRWCGVAAPGYACPACGSRRLRATVTGAARTADEIGRAFPGTLLRSSTGGSVLDTVPAEAAIIVATPGAEPLAEGGYGAVMLLDGGLLLARPDLRATEETLRRWMAAAALARPAGAGGRVIIGADPDLASVQALIRWDAPTHAAAELAARRELHFPPTVAMAAMEGGEAALGTALAALDGPETIEILGPTPILDGPRPPAAGPEHPDGDRVRALLRVPPSDRRALARALQVLTAHRSAHKIAEPLRIEVDPRVIG